VLDGFLIGKRVHALVAASNDAGDVYCLRLYANTIRILDALSNLLGREGGVWCMGRQSKQNGKKVLLLLPTI
jgi:hypothetical protein